jgi:hypothetical protein
MFYIENLSTLNEYSTASAYQLDLETCSLILSCAQEGGSASYWVIWIYETQLHIIHWIMIYYILNYNLSMLTLLKNLFVQENVTLCLVIQPDRGNSNKTENIWDLSICSHCCPESYAIHLMCSNINQTIPPWTTIFR